jgi:HEAT repeat protein
MTRLTLPIILLLAVVSTAFAQPAAIDLKGKTLTATFNELLPGMSARDNGARSAAQQRWQDICFRLGAPGNEKLRAEAATLMADKIGPKTPKAARLWLLTQLEHIGRAESVDALAAVLRDRDDVVREAATRALANNPSPKATARLTSALAMAKGRVKIGLLNGLGHRADPAAVSAIRKELGSSDEATAIAAARALGRIPGAQAAGALAGARTGAKGAVRAALADALLVHADRLLKNGKTADAAAIYKELNTPRETRPIRLAALRGTIQTSGDKAGERVLEILAGTDAAARNIAVAQIENLSAGALKPLAANLDRLPVPSQVSVITAIAARGDRAQLPVALAAAKSSNAEVRRAGVRALGRLGNASVVEFLLGRMTGKDALAGVAADSLAGIPAEGVNEKLVAVLEDEKSPARAVALIGILERRKAVIAIAVLLKEAGGKDAQVRMAAFNGLKTLAGPEHIPGMMAALLRTDKGKARTQAELAIATVAQQIPNPEKRAGAVLAIFKEEPKRAPDLLPLLGRLGGPEALMLIRRSLTDPALREAALVGLSSWPDAAANKDLLALAEKGQTDQEKRRALQALTRINTVLIQRSPEERLAILKVMKRTMALATRDDDRRAILAGLGNIRHIETLHYLLPYLDQPALAQAACKGIVELAHSRMLREPNRAEFVKALDRVIVLCKDRGLVDRAKQYKTGS